MRLGPIRIDENKDFRCGCGYKFVTGDYTTLVLEPEQAMICDRCAEKLKDKKEGQT